MILLSDEHCSCSFHINTIKQVCFNFTKFGKIYWIQGSKAHLPIHFPICILEELTLILSTKVICSTIALQMGCGNSPLVLIDATTFLFLLLPKIINFNVVLYLDFVKRCFARKVILFLEKKCKQKKSFIVRDSRDRVLHYS